MSAPDLERLRRALVQADELLGGGPIYHGQVNAAVHEALVALLGEEGFAEYVRDRFASMREARTRPEPVGGPQWWACIRVADGPADPRAFGYMLATTEGLRRVFMRCHVTLADDAETFACGATIPPAREDVASAMREAVNEGRPFRMPEPSAAYADSGTDTCRECLRLAAEAKP